jgi:hypothetical protein
MEYHKLITVHGELESIKLSEEDILGVLDELSKFYEKYGTFGEAIQQNNGSQINAINVVSKICDDWFRIMPLAEEEQ